MVLLELGCICVPISTMQGEGSRVLAFQKTSQDGSASTSCENSKCLKSLFIHQKMPSPLIGVCCDSVVYLHSNLSPIVAHPFVVVGSTVKQEKGLGSYEYVFQNEM